MLRFPFRPGARRLIFALIRSGIAGMLIGSVVVISTRDAQLGWPILIAIVMVGAQSIVIAVATPAHS